MNTHSLSLELRDINNNILFHKTGVDEVVLAYRRIYKSGDKIVLKCSSVPVYLIAHLEDSLPKAFVYMKECEYVFEIPFHDDKKSYGEKSFTGHRHWASVCVARDYDLYNIHNVALNPFDHNKNSVLYPHVSSNIQSNNAQFQARNIVDGILVTNNHGSWPHSSWGINKKTNAWLEIDLGRPVCVKEIAFYLRADFPHDSYWESITVEFSDKSKIKCATIKTGLCQRFLLNDKITCSVKIKNLIKARDNSQYPALSQMEIIGSEMLVE